jgi:CubicO group peptidase (beta-lactamase class C family)
MNSMPNLLRGLLLAALVFCGARSPLQAQAERLALGTPTSVGFPADLTDRLDEALLQALEAGASPGVEALVLVGHKEIYHRAFGFAETVPEEIPLQKDSVFDVASLTKVMVTTPLVLMLAEEGRLALEDPVSRFFPEYVGGGRESVRLRHLLTHTSGVGNLPGTYLLLSGKEAYLQAILAWPLRHPPGERRIYSDFGMMLLGFVVEKVSGQTLDSLADQRIFRPLGLRRTQFYPPLAWRWRCAALEICPWRQGLVRGVVHDENCYAMGGIAGHAGLFSTAEDMAVFSRMLLNGGTWSGKRVLEEESIEAMLADQNIPDATFQRLGWQVQEEIGQKTGWLLSPKTFGHTGFPGDSLWIDPDHETVAILLSNAIHPYRDQADRTLLRKGFHEILTGALEDRHRESSPPGELSE